VSLATETEIRGAYQGEAIAARYTRERFANELYGLLHQRQVEAIQAAIAERRPALSLEIAPGPGRLTREIAPTGKLLCLEFNEGMIAEGRRASGGRASWVRGNAFQLPFAQQFDLVYSFRFVRHFHRADRERLYAEIRRVLKPGGIFLMDAVNERISKPLREAHPEEYSIYDKLYQPAQLREELAGAGLEVIKMVPVQKFFRWQAMSQWLVGPRWRWLNRLVIGALELMPARDGLEWTVTCRRG
jgi:ubiquinone/menaquinone biosynthesis C-methylase UbiE